MSCDFCIKCDKELSVYCGPCVDSLRAERDQARAEVERLREALRVIAKFECNCDGWGGPCGCGERAVATAEDALAEPPVEHRPAMAQMAAALRKKAHKEREREEP